ncbi:phage tail family protein [Rathayibacter oskolensis]|uniref:phage tail domain-containing protein n=1 Tax=Rathayibacter oskolensis TaxID=1891671 RepID=UPI00265EEAF4|nr:phage tail domain-containing protein [Rathayibacter oskolensis]WKK71444.1 phage tail family protein [Rathayibacter oskolensis]
MPALQLSYGALNLQTSSITSTETDVWSPAQKNIQMDDLAQRDGAVFVRDSLRPKTFSVAGWIRAATIAELDAALDALFLGLSPSQQPFEIDNGTGRRRYICTAQQPQIARAKGQTSAGFSIPFTVPSGVGIDLADRALLQGTRSPLQIKRCRSR